MPDAHSHTLTNTLTRSFTRTPALHTTRCTLTHTHIHVHSHAHQPCTHTTRNAPRHSPALTHTCTQWTFTYSHTTRHTVTHTHTHTHTVSKETEGCAVSVDGLESHGPVSLSAQVPLTIGMTLWRSLLGCHCSVSTLPQHLQPSSVRFPLCRLLTGWPGNLLTPLTPRLLTC